MSSSAVVPGRLSKKDNELFRTLVNQYESKQYKKGIKTADTILKKNPNNGETQAMKGLILNCLGKKDEAYELVKLGLKNDVRSHICWHVYGLLYRSENNYKEASKCYLNALKIDSENQNILRDLSWLQIQMRDIPGFVATRRRILDLKPTVRASWVSFAVSNYIGEQYKVANDIVDKYIETVKEKDHADKYEESELLLFQNKCLEKAGLYNEALDNLRLNKSLIVDKLSWNIKLAEILTLNKNFEESQKQWLTLVNQQPDNYRFHCGLQTSYLMLDTETSITLFELKQLQLPSTYLQLTEEQYQILREVYQKNEFKSKFINKIHLTFYNIDNYEPSSVLYNEFKSLLEKHIIKSLKDALPALYHDICSLIRMKNPYSSKEDFIFIKDSYDLKNNKVAKLSLELVSKYIENLKRYESFNEISEEGSAEVKREPPSALLWALYLKCHLLELSGEYTEALVLIDECIAYTPTAIDMYVKKGKILKKLGSVVSAATVMDECRMLDLQDRYLNNKTTKYLLRSDQMTQAMSTIAMFTKHEGDPQKILYDLQCSWYELEAGESYFRTKQWAMALKKFYAIKKHFNDYYDDLFDFHGYCIRKTTLRAYLDVMNIHDNAYTHKFFQRATRKVLEIITHLLDCPEDIDGLGHLSTAERKKRREKIKKQKKKEEAKEKADLEDAKWSGTTNEDEAEKKALDDDPNGEKLLQTIQKDYLAEANIWVDILSSRISSCDCETLFYITDIALRRNKYLQAIRALNVGLKKEPLHPNLNVMLVKFLNKFKPSSSNKKQKAPNLNTNVSSIIKECLISLLEVTTENEIDVIAYFLKYFDKTKVIVSLPHLLGVLKCSVLVGKSEIVTEYISQKLADHSLFTGRGVNVTNISDIYKFLTSIESMIPLAETFKAEAIALFPDAIVFKVQNLGDEECVETIEN